MFGTGTVSETAPYHWRDQGRVPYTPLPTLVAYVLSRHIGRTITAEELWGTHAPAAPAAVPASAGFEMPWSTTATMQVVDAWIASGLIDRRMFLAVTGGALAEAALRVLPALLEPHDSAAVDEQPDLLVEQIEQTIPMLQRLDDAKGGAANLAYIGAQVRAVAVVLREHRGSDATRRQLLHAMTDLCQLAGWMAIDASENGLSQRYLFTALRTAHSSNYASMAGHILADLSGQATLMGAGADAVDLGQAAVRVSASAPPRVRASIHSRLAHAYAGTGDLLRFNDTLTQAREAFHGQPADEPDWMYYLTDNHIDCQAGYSLVMLAKRKIDDGDQRGAATALHRGQQLLEAGAHQRSLHEPAQRRALYEGAWLGLAYALDGQYANACRIGQTAISRLPRVRSPRSNTVLHDLVQVLAAHNRRQDVRDFLALARPALAGDLRAVSAL
ncbi:hypothetical protein HDA40_002059 [Hamadaea flava]|nr:hypothetical protein [Hamadaea flava]MCP2323552.1 hypothetical protein [Hamadaea flava]